MKNDILVFNASFYYSTKKHVLKDNFFEPGNGFLKIETILDAQRLLATNVGEIRMVATLFIPDKACHVSNEEGDFISFRQEFIYSSDITSLESNGHVLSVTAENNITYCVLLGNKKS